MRDFDRLFRESVTGANQLEKKLSPRFEYADLVTFKENKKVPIYNWFYYKEGFSGSFVKNALQELHIPKGSTVLDPFCGAGNTLLAAKQSGYNSVGFDILPLGVFVSRVKLEEDCNLNNLEKEIRRISSLKFGEPKTKLVDIKFIDMRRAFSRYARNDVPFFREKIMEIEDEKIRNFMLLGLISIVGEASNVKKDGGVLRIVHKQHLPPVRYLLKNRLKRMFKDLKKIEKHPGTSSRVFQGDARSLDLEDESVDVCITSPPYLNFVDYTKLYALELSLLVSSNNEILELRKKSMKSHISAKHENEMNYKIDKIFEKNVISVSPGYGIPEVVHGYLRDLYESVAEIHRVLKPDGKAVLVIGNAALPGITVDVDLALAEMGADLGMEVKDIWVANVRWADVHGISKPRPVRESCIVLEK